MISRTPPLGFWRLISREAYRRLTPGTVSYQIIFARCVSAVVTGEFTEFSAISSRGRVQLLKSRAFSLLIDRMACCIVSGVIFCPREGLALPKGLLCFIGCLEYSVFSVFIVLGTRGVRFIKALEARLI